MKNITKILMASMLVVALVFTLVACGEIDINKIKGSWTISTIDGKDVETFASENNLTKIQASGNYIIEDNGKIVAETAAAKTEGTYTKGSDGIKATIGGGDLGFVYDAKADTLTFKVDVNGKQVAYVLVKGAADFTATDAPAEEGGEEAPAEEGGEEAAEGGEEAAE